jgi:hypothetical protein
MRPVFLRRSLVTRPGRARLHYPEHHPQDAPSEVQERERRAFVHLIQAARSEHYGPYWPLFAPGCRRVGAQRFVYLELP